MSSSETDLPKVPDDILSQIINRLDVVESICSGAVSTTWRNLPGRKYCNKTQIPWLMLSSRDKNEYRYFYSITEKKKYDIYLPDIGGSHCVGSSQGFLISVDKSANLHATNPITGAHISLPPTSNSPYFKGVITDADTGQITHYIENCPPHMQLGVDFVPVSVSNRREYHYKKVILSPSKDIAVTICGGEEKIAFARIGDDKWTALEVLVPYFDDAIFHKGRLYVINSLGTMVIFDDLECGKHTLVSLSFPLDNEFIFEVSWYLVESPDGEDLFLVYKFIEEGNQDHPKTFDIRVFLLDKTTYTWKQIQTLGDVALFLGYNHSMSLCTQDFPSLKRDSIYFTGDNFEFFFKSELAGDMGVFNLEDGNIEPIYVNNDLDRLNWPPPMWFLPTL